MSPMLTETLISATAREGRAILAAVKSDPDAEVACCPGWNTTQLLGHVGHVHRFVTSVVAPRAMRAPERVRYAAPVEPWDWYEEGLETLLAALRDLDPAEPLWSWTDRRNGGFYHRRMAHENTIHRWDAENATGTPAHIDSDIAADGVGEVLAVGMRYRGDGSPIDYPDSSVLLLRTDGPDRWLIRTVDHTLLVATNGDAGDRADATLTGPAEDLYLHLWGRPAHALRISGNADAAAAWATVAP